MEFKKGDRVVCIQNPRDNCRLLNKVGTVVSTTSYGVGVAFDEDIDGHTLGRRCVRGCGWWLPKECITPATCNNYKVVITIEGNTTIAKFYCGDECVEQEIAKCNPSDKFDPLVGAQIALQRIVGAHGSKFVVNSEMFNDVEVI